MTKLSIYEEGVNKPASLVFVGSTRSLYYVAMQMIRKYRRDGIDVPYMVCSYGKLNFLLTCKRMAYNFGFDE